MLSALFLAAAAPLTPSGPWTVEAPDNLCMLSRSYGAEPDRVQVGFQPMPRFEGMELVVISPLRGYRPATGTAKVTRLPDGRVFAGHYYSLATPGAKLRLTRISLSRELFDTLDRTSAIRIAAKPIDVTVAVGRFEKAASTFRWCEDDLLTHWGIAPATVRAGAPPQPRRPVRDFFRRQDYPADALKGGYIGQVRAALTIDADGRVSDCRVVASIGQLFDKTTCERARLIPFSAGRDAAGAPARSLYMLSVRWSVG